MITTNPHQLYHFKEAARDLGANEDEKHWDERLRKVAKAKVPGKPE